MKRTNKRWFRTLYWLDYFQTVKEVEQISFLCGRRKNTLIGEHILTKAGMEEGVVGYDSIAMFLRLSVNSSAEKAQPVHPVPFGAASKR
jgi:hypothetical protein